MSFDSLLGNQRLKENLSRALQSGHLSHFYLICGPEGSGKQTLANLLAAAALCRGTDKPCLTCSSCRKVLTSNHPDLITVADPDHKNVAVKIIRQMRDDLFIRPNESDRKVYLFPQDMGIEGQNALLKVLEEPPAYGVFILLANNPESLLPTVRSRCTELKMQPIPEDILRARLRADFPDATAEELDAAISRSGGFLGQAAGLLRQEQSVSEQTRVFGEVFAGRDAAGLAILVAGMEKYKRDALLDELNAWLQLLTQSLVCRAGNPVTNPAAKKISGNRSAAEIHGATQSLQKALTYAHSNVSPAAICGWLSWALR